MDAVAGLELIGGFLPPGLIALRPPQLVVYRDGVAIADAAYWITLNPQDLSTLIARLLADLQDPAVSRAKRADTVADAPTTALLVRAGTGTKAVSVYALDEVREHNVYPAVLYDARDRLATIHDRAVNGGTVYRAERIRLVTRPGDMSAPTQPWPAGIPIPDRATDAVATFELSGTVAVAATRQLRQDPQQGGDWPSYRTADGGILQAAWRYLIPGE
jgi:hypothetical protein